MITTLKRAEPTQSDAIHAKFIGPGHEYSSDQLQRRGTTLLEVLVCRERELADAQDRLERVAEKAAGIVVGPMIVRERGIGS